jgi:hypothetical protein
MYHDNKYPAWRFKLDMWLKGKTFGLVMFEREDRESVQALVWRVVRRKWAIFDYRVRHRLLAFKVSKL